METTHFATRRGGMDPDRLKYAAACLDQGMTYQAAASASGINETALRDLFPGKIKARSEYTPATGPDLSRIAPAIAEATPSERRAGLALTMALIAEDEGQAELRKMVATILCALPVPSVRSPRQVMMDIAASVATAHGLSVADVLGRCRTAKVAHARQELYYRLRQSLPRLSLPQIGRLLDRDHTTILYGIAKYEARVGAA